MPAATSIEWTDATWNPTRGCNRQSAGCANCYAEQQAMRIVRMDRGRGVPEGQGSYDGLVRMTSQGPRWTGEVREVHAALDWPLRQRKPLRIFVNSMGDLFHPGVTVEFIALVFAFMAYARQHTFQILTKFPDRMAEVLTSDEFAEEFESACAVARYDAEEILAARGEFGVHERRRDDIRAFEPLLPLGNVQLGASAENQAALDMRLSALLQTPAAVRFLSLEPLLGAVRIPPELLARIVGTSQHGQRFLDWIIVGGESGHRARPVHPAWVRELRDQCTAAGVPFFFKQWGQWLPATAERRITGMVLVLEGAGPFAKEPRWHGFEDGQRVARVGKKAAGRKLDGREWSQFPGQEGGAA